MNKVVSVYAARLYRSLACKTDFAQRDFIGTDACYTNIGRSMHTVPALSPRYQETWTFFKLSLAFYPRSPRGNKYI